MSYLEEWDRIEQMIENHNTSKSTVVTSEKRQDLALSHIAKCLSVFADDIANAHASVDSIRRCGECVYQGNTEHCASCQIIFNVTGFEKKKAKPCNNCIHSNDEYELNCSVCDEWHSEYKPFDTKSKKEEIEVECPKCKKIITIPKKLRLFYMHLKCPNCNTDFSYEIDTGICSY